MLFRKKKNLNEASLGLKIGAIFGILFLHVPLFLLFYMHLQLRINLINFHRLVIL